MSHITITSQNFTSEVSQFSGKVFVDFWASWCGPCQMLNPIIEQLTEKLKDRDNVKIAKVDIEENQDLATKFSVQYLPTVIIFENGQITATLTGLRSEQEYLKALE